MIKVRRQYFIPGTSVSAVVISIISDKKVLYGQKKPKNMRLFIMINFYPYSLATREL